MSSLNTFLSRLGLTTEQSRVYETLTGKGALTILELSRTSGVSRTQVYRVIEELKEKGLVEEIVDEYRRLIQGSDVSQLKQLVMAQKHTTEELEGLFPVIEEELAGSMGTGHPETKVLFYRGRAGLRQLIWHTLRAKKETVGYTYRAIEEYVGNEFMEDWMRAFVRKGLVMHEVYSDTYLESVDKNPGRFPKTFISRYISSSVLHINIQMDIYNDVVAQYNWHEGEIFGVEIYNTKVAAFHKQLFEIIWKIARPKVL